MESFLQETPGVKRNKVKAMKLSVEESEFLDRLFEKRLAENKSSSMSHLFRQLIYCGLNDNTKIEQ